MDKKERIEWKDYFYYDESSPTCLRWAVNRYCGPNHSAIRIAAGSAAGSKLTGGRWQVMLDGESYKVHRIIWELHNGEIPEGMVIDHIDGNANNNALLNLRVTVKAVNSRNRKKQKTNLSGETGVSFATKKSANSERTYWVAQWYDSDGKFRQKAFSITKLGNDKAFEDAKQYRQEKIASLNDTGAGYTERHGT